MNACCLSNEACSWGPIDQTHMHSTLHQLACTLPCTDAIPQCAGMTHEEQELACLHTDALLVRTQVALTMGKCCAEQDAEARRNASLEASAKREQQADIYGVVTAKERRKAMAAATLAGRPPSHAVVRVVSCIRAWFRVCVCSCFCSHLGHTLTHSHPQPRPTPTPRTSCACSATPQAVERELLAACGQNQAQRSLVLLCIARQHPSAARQAKLLQVRRF